MYLQSNGQCPLGFWSGMVPQWKLCLGFLDSSRLPDISLPSTRTKPIIHGVASCTGLNTPTCNILSTSCWKASLRWTGTGWWGVCFGGMPGSSCIWCGGPGNLPSPSKTSG